MAASKWFQFPRHFEFDHAPDVVHDSLVWYHSTLLYALESSIEIPFHCAHRQPLLVEYFCRNDDLSSYCNWEMNSFLTWEKYEMMTLNDELPIVVAVTAGTAAANGQYDHNDGKYEDKSSYNPN